MHNQRNSATQPRVDSPVRREREEKKIHNFTIFKKWKNKRIYSTVTTTTGTTNNGFPPTANVTNPMHNQVNPCTRPRVHSPVIIEREENKRKFKILKMKKWKNLFNSDNNNNNNK